MSTLDRDDLAWLDGLYLGYGSHDDPSSGVCIMEGQDRALVRLRGRLQQEGECLTFVGNRTDQGYGRIGFMGKSVGAHRLAWLLLVGPIPDGLCVLHRCDNPPCCNVAHLFLGTVAENNRDRAEKGRSKGTFTSSPDHPATLRSGERHWGAKLSDADVVEIRSRHGAGETQTALARAFNVNSATVSRIVRRVWRQEVA